MLVPTPPSSSSFLSECALCPYSLVLYPSGSVHMRASTPPSYTRAKVDEQLQQLHGILKSITCVCNKASNALPPKWFEEGSEDLRGGGGGGGEAVIAAAAAAAAAAVAGSIGNKFRLVLVEDVVTRMQEQQKQVEDLKGIEDRVTVTHSSSQRHKKLHEQQQEQQEEQIAAAEVDQSKEKLGNVIVGNVQLEAEVNTQRSRIDENEKVIVVHAHSAFPTHSRIHRPLLFS
ncbi:unnamed protein product [Closterium sp. Naga37s-1]|nr:unnamed protein product [Closterium sp. Naga37s-1]